MGAVDLQAISRWLGVASHELEPIQDSGFAADVWKVARHGGSVIVRRRQGGMSSDLATSLNEIVLAAGVPAPALLDVAEIEGATVEVWTFVSGTQLGWRKQLNASDGVWPQLGDAFGRLHACDPPTDIPTLSTRDDLAILRLGLDHQVPDVSKGFTSARLGGVLAAYDGALADAIGDDTIVHGDPNFLNVLVTPDGSLAGICDWDGAMRADRHRDLARLDWHAVQHGLDGLPSSFWDAYSMPVLEPAFTLHRLGLAIFRAADGLVLRDSGVDPAWQATLDRTVAGLVQDLARVPEMIDRLRRAGA